MEHLALLGGPVLDGHRPRCSAERHHFQHRSCSAEWRLSCAGGSLWLFANLWAVLRAGESSWSFPWPLLPPQERGHWHPTPRMWIPLQEKWKRGMVRDVQIPSNPSVQKRSGRTRWPGRILPGMMPSLWTWAFARQIRASRTLAELLMEGALKVLVDLLVISILPLGRYADEVMQHRNLVILFSPCVRAFVLDAESDCIKAGIVRATFEAFTVSCQALIPEYARKPMYTLYEDPRTEMQDSEKIQTQHEDTHKHLPPRVGTKHLRYIEYNVRSIYKFWTYEYMISIYFYMSFSPSFVSWPLRTPWVSHWPMYISCQSSLNWAGSHGGYAGQESGFEKDCCGVRLTSKSSKMGVSWLFCQAL